uniref:Similar to human chromosome 21 open reading frame 91 n=1 Tax=Rattus norvegicus TaxID=10116 RepID=A0ABK0LXG3_RAT
RLLTVARSSKANRESPRAATTTIEASAASSRGVRWNRSRLNIVSQSLTRVPQLLDPFREWRLSFGAGDGVPKSNLLHTKSLRGHKDCFEKYHLIANQDCSRSKLSKSTYEGVKTILSKKINWIVQYAQNKNLDLDSECSKTSQHHLFNFRHKPEKKLLPQFDSQVPKYSAKGLAGSAVGISSYTQRILDHREDTDFGLGILEDADALWTHSHNQAQKTEETSSVPERSVQTQSPRYSREELNSMTLAEVVQLSTKLRQQIQEVFEELTHQVQEKDSLASELHVRHVAIEQLLKNCSKLPCLQVGRTGTRPHLSTNN